MSTSSARQPFIGIDFGTSNCKVAAYDSIRGAIVLKHAENHYLMPSVVYYGKSQMLVGNAAVKMLDDELEAQYVVQSIKRDIGKAMKIPVQGRQKQGELVYITPVEIVTDILRKLRGDTSTLYFNKEEIKRCVLTYPASYGPIARENLRKAAQNAGFSEVEMITEPRAAAIAYTQLVAQKGKNVLVYDLGAGTFDLALVTRQGDATFNSKEFPGFEGLSDCGGDDFDNALYEYCDQQAQKNLQPTRHLSLTADRDLNMLEHCRKAKEQLSNAQEWKVKTWLQGQTPFQCIITRSDFEKLIDQLVEKTIQKTQALLQEAQKQNFVVDTFILIGGSTRVPLIKQRLSTRLQALKLETLEWGERDVAVALGAAYYGAVKFCGEKLKGRDDEHNRLLVSSNPEHRPDHTTISAALRAAQPGTEIYVRPGIYKEGLVLDKPVRIVGDGPREQIIVESSTTHCVFMQTTEATVEGLTLRCEIESPSQKFVGVYIPQGCLKLIHCDITSNDLACIAIRNTNTRPLIQHCRIHDGKDLGVVVYKQGEGTLQQCEISGHKLSGIQTKEGGHPIVEDCTIRACGDSGLLFTQNGSGSFTNCRIEHNGKAGVEIREGSTPTLSHCYIHSNKYVGVWAHDSGGGSVTNSTIRQNKAGAWKTWGSSGFQRSANIDY